MDNRSKNKTLGKENEVMSDAEERLSYLIWKQENKGLNHAETVELMELMEVEPC